MALFVYFAVPALLHAARFTGLAQDPKAISDYHRPEMFLCPFFHVQERRTIRLCIKLLASRVRLGLRNVNYTPNITGNRTTVPLWRYKKGWGGVNENIQRDIGRPSLGLPGMVR